MKILKGNKIGFLVLGLNLLKEVMLLIVLVEEVI
jgi:hypothetical protein